MSICYVVGASARSAANSARRMGYRVVSIDLFGDRDTGVLSTCHVVPELDAEYLTQFEFVDASRWIPTGGLENRSEFVEWLEDKLNSTEGIAAQIRSLRSIENWKRWCGNDPAWKVEPRIYFPEIRSKADPDILTNPKDWVFKPISSAGGIGLRMSCSSEAAFKGARDDAFYFQKFVRGTTYGAVFARSPTGTRLLGLTQNLSAADIAQVDFDSAIAEPLRLFSIGASESPTVQESEPKGFAFGDSSRSFVYSGSFGPFSISPAIRRSLESWADKIYSETSFARLMGVDFIVDDTGDWAMLEINPRWTASMEVIELGYRQNLVAFELDGTTLSSHTQFDSDFDATAPSSTVLKLILYARADFVVSNENSQWMFDHRFYSEERDNVRSRKFDKPECLVGFADIPCGGTKVHAGLPVATILVETSARNVRQIQERDRGRTEPVSHARLDGKADAELIREATRLAVCLERFLLPTAP